MVLQQYSALRELFLLLYNAKGTAQEPEEIELLGSLMRGVALKAEGFFGEKASEETAQLLSFDGVVAIAEAPRRGLLVVLHPGTLRIPENTTIQYTVEYHEGTGNSGTLTRFWGVQPIITGPGGTCGGNNLNNLTNEQTCTMQVNCAARSRRQQGVAGVTGAAGVTAAIKRVECT